MYRLSLTKNGTIDSSVGSFVSSSYSDSLMSTEANCQVNLKGDIALRL